MSERGGKEVRGGARNAEWTTDGIMSHMKRRKARHRYLWAYICCILTSFSLMLTSFPALLSIPLTFISECFLGEMHPLMVPINVLAPIHHGKFRHYVSQTSRWGR